MRYEAVLFDLFGTLVHFTPEVPVTRVAGRERRSVAEWLREAAGRELPGVPFEDFLSALGAETERIVRARAPEYREVSSEERFRRTLLRLGIPAEAAARKAAVLCAAHMAHLAARTFRPAGVPELLQAVRGRHRTALVSNFDHGPTARRIVREHGLESFFDALLISAEVGRRKPHPDIFHRALAATGAAPGSALHVGDSLADDVCGAVAAGIDVAWLGGGQSPPPGGPRPTYTLARLEDVIDVLA